jgi:hypothetical protein
VWYIDRAMKYTIEQIAQYVESLPAQYSELLNEKNHAKLDSFRVKDLNLNSYLYEFPNGYGVEIYSPAPALNWTIRIFPLDDHKKTLRTLSGQMQVACFIEAHEVMKFSKRKPTNHSDNIIREIRDNCLNADDLAKISIAIEAMREELIEESAARFERATHA